jgi:phosphoribosylformylglycinamidine (FGAM) synthase-like enzyme
VQSAHDLSEGGLAVALAECLFTNETLGAEVSITGNHVSALFSETQSRFLITVNAEHKLEFESLVDAVQIGTVNDSAALQITNDESTVLKASVEELKAAWKGAIPCYLKSRD